MNCIEGSLPMKVILKAIEKILERRSSLERLQFEFGIKKILENLVDYEPTVPEPEPNLPPELDLDAIMRDEEYRNEINRDRAKRGLVKFA